MNKWVVVGDRLPSENDEILVACDWFDIGLSAWCEDGEFYLIDGVHKNTKILPGNLDRIC